VNEPIPAYHERIPELAGELAERGCLGVMVLDTNAMTEVEDEYGSDAYDEVRRRTFKTLAEQRGKDYRNEDILCLDKPRGHNFIVFLERKRRRNNPPSVADLKAVRLRMITSLAANLGRAAFPYIKNAPVIEVGYGMALYNPLLHPERILRRAVAEALDIAAHARRGEQLVVREKLQDLILRERVVTAYQAIMELKDRTVLGFEALSRGARGTGLESAYALFGAAEEHGLLVELDRLCRRRALLSSGRIPSNAKIFVNTLPATIRDPQFRGKALIDFLDRAQVSPDRIVIEITEKLVIDNYNLFREAMAYFTDLGMSFAVDDVGAGYSGVE
jgi:EAL domain-containing protein (putative c-di-GMP-specific phosphodiesterase class I)